MLKPKRLSQTAIAKATGVSRPTVSLVLRGGTGSSEETKARVLAAAEKMGYRPNALVHSIRSGKSRTIGVLVPPFDSFWKEICHGIHDRLTEANHLPLFLWQDATLHDDPLALRQIHRLLDHWIDGVILWPYFTNLYADHLREFEKRNIPLVSIDHTVPRLKADTLSNDETAVAAEATRHLLGLGHRSFLVLSGPKGLGWADARCRALREEFKAAKGCRWVEVRTESKNDAAGESAAVLRQNPGITAAIACTDHLAADLYRAAQHLGWKIPGRLSVLGVGGLDFGPLLSPPLTSIAQNGLALGRKAAETVLGRSLGKISGPPRHYKIPVQPAAGSSTAARLPTR